MVGIDVSKDTLQCALLRYGTDAPLWEMTVANSTEGIAALVQRVPKDARWVVEPTGRYSLLVVQNAQQLDRRVLLAQPRKAKSFLASVQSRAKTDKLDARGLARYALSQPLCAYPLKSVVIDEIDQLLTARKGVSHSLSSLRQRAQELPAARQALAPVLDSLARQLKELDRQIASRVKDAPAMAVSKRLQKVPGIGPVTSVALTSRLSGRSFSHPDKFVAYIGLDVGVVQSGKCQGERGLTKQGDAELRRLLYLAAQSNLRTKDSPFKAQYEREIGKGLSKTAALNAVARKLAKVCWSLHQHNADYVPERVNRQLLPAESSIDKEERAAGGAGAASAPRPSRVN